MSGAAEDPLITLVNEARPRLWTAFVAVRGEHGADDAVAEALAWAAANRDRVIALDNPVGYLYRVGLTRSTPPRQPQLPTPDEIGLPHIEPTLIPALLALPERQRAAVWLVHGCGWTHAETARALGVKRTTVGTHVNRAMNALRLKLEVTIDG